MEASAAIIAFENPKTPIAKQQYTDAIHLWCRTHDAALALTREEIGAMSWQQRMDAQRKALIVHLARYYRRHPRADVAPGVDVVMTLLSDNDKGTSNISQAKLAELFGRSRSTIADAQARLREAGLIVTGRGCKAGSYPVIPRAVIAEYNHLTWLVDAICTQDASQNCPAGQDNSELSGQPLQFEETSGQPLQLPKPNCSVEGVGIVRPAPTQFHTKNSTTLHRAASVVAAGLATAIGALPAAADPPVPPALVKPASPVSHKELSDKLFDAAGNAMNRTVPSLEYMSMPMGWLESGCDLELDILPVVRSMASRKPPQSIGTWKFFAGAIADARAARTAPMPPGSVRQKSQASNWHDEQERALNFLFRK